MAGMQDLLVRWMAKLLPQKIAEAPERVLINFACVLIGSSALSTLAQDRPGGLLASWPAGFGETWALSMIFGGAFVLVGYWNNPARRWANSLERLGYLLILVSALVYGIALVVVFGWDGVRTALIFFAIAAAKTIRLLIASAYQTYRLRGGAGGLS